MALSARILHRSAEVTLARVACDGVDHARPDVEPARADQIVVVLRGAFELRAGTRLVADPSRAVVLRDGGEHVFRHPAGGDVCLAVSGPIARRLAQRGPRLRPLEARAWSRLRRLAAAASHDDALAVAAVLHEALAAPEHDVERPRRERALAEEAAFLLRRRVDARPSLGELARAVGCSEFHLCRAFRRATGVTIGAFARELRLRHALALVLDTTQPLVDVALATGFSSHAHLTTQFRARFGRTPQAARRAGMI
jgi:AraC-like DNA-binding protein